MRDEEVWERDKGEERWGWEDFGDFGIFGDFMYSLKRRVVQRILLGFCCDSELF